MADLRLTTIAAAIAPYEGLTVRQVRAWIAAGRLPATKIGRAFLVDPHDLAELLRPKLRTPVAPKKRESESERIRRQLARAGCA